MVIYKSLLKKCRDRGLHVRVVDQGYHGIYCTDGSFIQVDKRYGFGKVSTTSCGEEIRFCPNCGRFLTPGSSLIDLSYGKFTGIGFILPEGLDEEQFED